MPSQAGPDQGACSADRQSLVLPFAYLFSTEHTTSTVDLLSQIFVNVPSTGETRSGLEMVLSSWCETSETVTGSWNIRVTYVSCHLIPFPTLLQSLHHSQEKN